MRLAGCRSLSSSVKPTSKPHHDEAAAIRILHVIASLAATTGGPAKAVVDMAAAVARLGHHVVICSTDREMSVQERPPKLGEPVARDGVETVVYAQHWPQVIGASWPLYRGLAHLIPQSDIVHVHSLYLFHDWAAWRLCRKHSVPYIVRPHGTLDPYIWQRHRRRKELLERLFQSRMLREAAAIHYTAEEEMALATPYVGGTPGVVVPNGLDLREYADLPPAGEFRKQYPVTGGRRIVLFLGRLNFKKGLDLLIPAFARAAARHNDLHLVIAGPDDGMLADTQRWVAEHKLEPRVTFTGMLAGRVKLAALSDAFMFVLPSYSENFGIAAVEALACGLPVAITDKVNTWRDVQSAGAGLVGPPTVDSVAEQIGRLAGDPAAVFAMGARGRSLVANKYAWPRIARSLEALYRSAAVNKSR
jgi:glycosyltransferase involved in cell wall biosynthesis